MLDFRVETFLAVCRHMNFTKAARELNITQPAVSHHMHYLEQAYGTALFQHNGKRLQLTEAGEILRRTLMTMKHDEQHLQKRMQQAASGTRDYSFGATLSVAEFMINEALGRVLRPPPGSPPPAVTALVALRPALRQQGGDLVLIQLMHQRFPPLRFGVKDV